MSATKQKVAIIGSGNWGSAIAKIAGLNVQRHSHIFEREVRMFVHEEQVRGTKDARRRTDAHRSMVVP